MRKDNRPATKLNTDYPLLRHLIALLVVVVVGLTMGHFLKEVVVDDFMNNRAPNSTHVASRPVEKNDSVFVQTTSNGKPLSVTVDSYLTNNPELDQIKDYSKLTDITNIGQPNNPPELEKKGNLTWNIRGKDVNYEGTGDPEQLPLTIDVKYFLNGKELKSKDLVGKSGKVKIKIKYDSREYVKLNGSDTKVPYFVLCAMLCDSSMSHVRINNGRVIENKSSNSIVLGTAMPGVRELSGSSEFGGYVTDEIVIKGDAKKFQPASIISVASGNILAGVDTKKLNKLNVDKKVAKAENFLKKSMAFSKKAAAALTVVDKKVMPETVKMTKRASSSIDSLASALNKLLSSVRLSSEQGLKYSSEAVSYLDMSTSTIEDHFIPSEETNKSANKASSELTDDISQQIDSQENMLSELKENEPDNPAVPVIEENIDYLNSINEAITSAEQNNYTQKTEEEIKTDKAFMELYAMLVSDGNSSKETKNEKLITYIKEQIAKIKSVEPIDEEALAYYEGLLTAYNNVPEGKEDQQYVTDYLNDKLNEAKQQTPVDQELVSYYTNLIEEYNEVKKESISEEGKVTSMLSATSKSLEKALSVSQKLHDQLNDKKQDAMVSKTKSLAHDIRKLESTTKSVGKISSKMSRAVNRISKQINSLYNKQLSKLFKFYNTNLKGLVKTIKKVQKAQKKTDVFSGRTDEMKGTTTYLFFTDVNKKDSSTETESNKKKATEIQDNYYTDMENDLTD